MSDIFVGRQPIFDSKMQVFAYELLFRAEAGPLESTIKDGDSATSQIILNTFVNLGLEKIVGQHKAFLKLSRKFLSDPELLVAPPDRIVLEVLQDVEPEDNIIAALQSFKQQGYSIALDNFIDPNDFEPFIELTDIVKLDVLNKEPEELAAHAERFRPYNVKLLAEKIETYDQFESMKELGFDYFQGYFFAKPTLIEGKSITPNQLNLLKLVATINNPEVEVEELSNIISTDVSLSHKVLKFINSPLSGLRREVDSIQQAVVLVGLKTIKNWIMLMALAHGSNKPQELSTMALIRARCCELMAHQCDLPKPEGFFTVGLFSVLDAMMDRPLEEVLAELPLASESKTALLDHTGLFGEALSSTLSMERNDFGLTGFADLNLIQLSDIYHDAIHWADERVNQL